MCYVYAPLAHYGTLQGQYIHWITVEKSYSLLAKDLASLISRVWDGRWKQQTTPGFLYQNWEEVHVLLVDIHIILTVNQAHYNSTGFVRGEINFNILFFQKQ